MGSKKLITLKEASEISGYAPDYIGQLIRSGKVSGKQVYSNIAWMTTEEAVREYMKNGKSAKKISSNKTKAAFFFLKNPFTVYRIFLYLALIFLISFSFILFYIFAVGIDKSIEKKSLKKIEIINE